MALEVLKPTITVSEGAFFNVLNAVLVSFGRDELESTSAHRDVIRVEPEDRVLQILAGLVQARLRLWSGGCCMSYSSAAFLPDDS